MDPAMTIEEQRHHPRTKVHHIVYISLDYGNGAMLLSEDTPDDLYRL